MPAFECKIFLYDGLYIWTETFYWVGGSIYQAMDNLYLLAQARIPLCGGSVGIGRLRVATDPPTRQVLTARLPITGPPPQGKAPWDAVLITLAAQGSRANPHYNREMLVRGLPQGFKATVSPWREALQGWIDLLAALGFCLKVCDRDIAPVPVVGITCVSLVATNVSGGVLNPKITPEDVCEVVVVTQTDPGWPLFNPSTGRPNRIKILGSQWAFPSGETLNLFPTPLPLIATGPNVLAVQGKLPSDGGFTKTGQARLYSPVYYPIIGGTYSRPGTRDTAGLSKYKMLRSPVWTLGTRLPAGLVELPAPPTGGLIVPFPGPVLPPYPPGFRVIANAYDLIQEVALGYVPQPDGTPGNIRISQIYNLDNSYLITMSGTNSVLDPVTGIPGDVTLALTQTSEYPLSVFGAMKQVKPGLCTVFLAGDSLGGMVAQVVSNGLSVQAKSVVNIVTFNSPMMNAPKPGQHVVMFAEHGDAVISATLLGQQQNFIGHPEQTFISQTVYPNPVAAHKAIYTDKGLQYYDVIGNLIEGADFQTFDLSPPQIFPANPNLP